MDFIKIKSFSTSSKTVKSEDTNWKTIFANHISEKGLVSLGEQPEPDDLAYFHTGHISKAWTVAES